MSKCFYVCVFDIISLEVQVESSFFLPVIYTRRVIYSFITTEKNL